MSKIKSVIRLLGWVILIIAYSFLAFLVASNYQEQGKEKYCQEIKKIHKVEIKKCQE